MVVPEDDVTLPAAQLDAFEAFGETLAMLTDSPKQRVLDSVSAALCGGRSWREVRNRSPLNAVEPLYHFQVFERDAEGGVGGCFDLSPACHQLVEELDLGGARIQSRPLRHIFGATALRWLFS
jgi:hypothetical protein